MPLDLTGSNLFFVLALFGAGLFCIMKGGDLFVDAATWIAESTGIPKFIIGATVVSFATTMPELLVSLFSAFEGNADIAVGNAVGSVTANTGLILCISLVCMQAICREGLPAAVCHLLAVRLHARRQSLPVGERGHSGRIRLLHGRESAGRAARAGG